MNKQKIKIDIVSDINCPWCYLGEQRLRKAIEATGDHYEFELEFKPFELNLNAPQEGENKHDYFIRNYGSEALPRLHASSKHLTEAGEAEGVIFDFDRSSNVYNTFNGHRLIWLAEKYSVQEKVATALFKSNFTDGENVNDIEILTRIGVENGIPDERLNTFFSSEEGKKEVREMEHWAQQAGITGVPAFIFNDKYLVSGAQPVDTLKSVFSQIAPVAVLEEIKLEGESCDLDSNC